MRPSPFLRFTHYSQHVRSRLLLFRRRPIEFWRGAKGRGGGRRFQSTAADPAGASVNQSTFQRLWNSPIGLKTVHFWAPVMKWAIVLAGVADFYRPAEKLSLTQNLALTATGAIWTRWCLIIKPKNYLLAAVNFFLACVGTVQVSRILAYQRAVGNTDVKQEVQAATEEVVEGAKGVAHEAKAAVKKLV